MPLARDFRHLIAHAGMVPVVHWEKSAWTSLPLGVKLAKLVKFGKLPVQLSGAYEYTFADDYVAPEWTVNFTAKFLFPF